jgi:hypothetical protein
MDYSPLSPPRALKPLWDSLQGNDFPRLLPHTCPHPTTFLSPIPIGFFVGRVSGGLFGSSFTVSMHHHFPNCISPGVIRGRRMVEYVRVPLVSGVRKGQSCGGRQVDPVPLARLETVRGRVEDTPS